MTRFFIAIIFLVAAVAIFAIWTRSLWDEVSALGFERNATAKAVERFQSLRQVRDGLLADYNVISRDDLSRLNNFLPASPDRGKLLIELENLTRTHNVILRKVEIADSEDGAGQARTSAASLKKGPFEKVSFLFIVSGPYDAFRSFLTDLEKSLRPVDVDEISFTAGSKETYDFSIKAHTYWLKSK